jgi:hypothetical protein
MGRLLKNRLSGYPERGEWPVIQQPVIILVPQEMGMIQSRAEKPGCLSHKVNRRIYLQKMTA